MPFIYWPSAEVPYEIPKVWFFSRWVELLLLLSIIFHLPQISSKIFSSSVARITLIYTGVVFITAIIGVNFIKSLIGNFYRSDGLITFLHIVGFYLFIVFFWKKDWNNKYFFQTIAFSNSIFSLWIIVDAVRLFIFSDTQVVNWWGALGGPFGQPVFLAGYIIVTIPTFIYQIKSSRNIIRIFWLAGLLFNLIALFFTRSWTAPFGILVLLSIYSFIYLKRRGRLIIGATLLIAFISISIWYMAHRPKTFVYEGRTRIYLKMFFSSLKRPLVGWGLANADFAFDASHWPVVLEKDIYIDKAHGSALEVFVTSGVFGLIFYLALLILVIKRLILLSRNGDFFYQTLLVMVLVFIIHSQTNIISISEEIIFWLAAGIVSREK
ncbi:hypothetical protein A3A93_04845 [Candidatus Roizmanbacteria bacterium RIFCSPLOWO2_01_FULL_38_12]|uniref:O-antigen ligase-related domain-containing protein n=1 Tax=Candidatus Roizmanbacteria bacterium RIFCSPLOWO2_01_FULL_38_12 TaxID=1802061 RepID=A0A1F7IVZ5_9BACT|nr:MAG: hypothetical protein A3F59_06095 [Candidatus Roizmanbacteria bacterium RIFCSPHIGHO2_12_FULL_38_13]OGK47536.1 MAG: hypothetical protein A3A93_04845 [Candidatus Roizmanbacteria bacterium RIFCSPLOWO2_01_FULL_38_12]